MANLRGVVNHFRESDSNNPVREKEDPTNPYNAERSGSRVHLESDGLVDSEKDPALGHPESGRKEDRDRKRNIQQQTDGKNPSTKIQDQFYQKYHEVAEECDKEFLSKYNEDLNTTLLFAGLFSAVASAFIIDVNSELKPDPNDETAALLRVLLYKIDNTTFGKDVPPLPQWTGPSHAMVQVQTILFASLSASLLSALLAVLGKQWLSRYDSADMKGTAVERGQNRQRKLDGIDAWHFRYVMEALPLMLQIALLLLACALARNFWEVNTVVASVVIGVTSLGMVFYLFIVVAGTVDKNCPYQTPLAIILRQILHLLRISSQPRGADQQTKLDLRCISWILHTSLDKRVHRLAFDYLWTIPKLPHIEPTLVSDCFNIFLGCINVNGYGVVVKEESKELVTAAATSFLRTSSQLLDTAPTSSTAIDLRRNYRKVFGDFSLICFEDLPFRFTMIAIHSLISGDRDFRDISWYGDRLSIPEHMLFTQYALKAAQESYTYSQRGRVSRWALRFAQYSLSLDPPPPALVVADCLKIIAIDLDCDVSVVTNSEEGVRAEDLLSVKVESFFNAEAEKTWSGQVESVSWLIAQKLDAMVGTNGPDSRLIFSKRKAIWTLLPHIAHLKQCQWELILTDVLRTGYFPEVFPPKDRHVRPFLATLLDRPSSHLLDRVVLLASTCVSFYGEFWDNSRVSRWNAIALNILKDERAVSDAAVRESVAEMLLQFASRGTLRLQIPAETWVWLKKPRSLSVLSPGRRSGTTGDVVRHIRGLGDIEILKSYFRLVWSEWDYLRDGGLREMENSIREDFGGVERWRDREELVEWLDQVLGRLSLGPAHFEQHIEWVGERHIKMAVSQYSSLRNTLLNVH